MSDLNVSILMILVAAASAIGWDCWLAYRGRLTSGGDYCDGLRAINKWSGGLLALMLLAIWWHVFGWIPKGWQ